MYVTVEPEGPEFVGGVALMDGPQAGNRQTIGYVDAVESEDRIGQDRRESLVGRPRGQFIDALIVGRGAIHRAWTDELYVNPGGLESSALRHFVRGDHGAGKAWTVTQPGDDVDEERLRAAMP